MPTLKTLGGKKESKIPSSKRWSKHDNFYSSTAWRKVRKVKLKSSPLCEDCKDKGIVKEAHSVDHVRPRKLWPELSVTLTNLRSLCQSHHAKKSAREQRINSKEEYEQKFKL